MNLSILRNIGESNKNAEFYSIILNETSDLPNDEHRFSRPLGRLKPFFI